MWLREQRQLQEWNSKPIVEVRIDALQDHKNLIIRNLGKVDIEDIRVFVTVYELKTRLIDDGHHMAFDGIDSYSKAGPLQTLDNLHASGGFKNINLLTEFRQIAPMYKWDSNQPEKRINIYYAYRVTFRNSVTKQRYVAHVFTTVFADFNANPFAEAETNNSGGGYEAGK